MKLINGARNNYADFCCLPPAGYLLHQLLLDALEITIFAVSLFFLPISLPIQSCFAGAVLIYFLSRRGRGALHTLQELFSYLSSLLKKDCVSCKNNPAQIAADNMKMLEQEAEYRQLDMPTAINIELSLRGIMADPEQRQFMEKIVEQVTQKILNNDKNFEYRTEKKDNANSCPE